MQSAIRAFVTASDDAPRREQLAEWSKDVDGLVPQLVYFSAHATDTRGGMTAGVVIEKMRIAPEVVIRALIPCLDSEDKPFASTIRSTLGGYEGRTGDRTPDFSIYRELLEDAFRAGKIPPGALVRYLYATDPGAAMLLMMRASGTRDPAEIKPILWAEHVIADTLWKQRYGFLKGDEIEPQAAGELERIAAHPAWWARLYAAAIMHQHPAFRVGTILEALARDESDFVRAEALSIRDSE